VPEHVQERNIASLETNTHLREHLSADWTVEVAKEDLSPKGEEDGRGGGGDGRTERLREH
jgi:hypothetical protein